MKMEMGGKGRDVKLKLGEEFEDIGPSGDAFKVRALCTHLLHQLLFGYYLSVPPFWLSFQK